MESSPRYLDPERGQLGRRRGHVPQISISDDSHHVTEAIGDMYGDSDWAKRDSTASSFASSPPPEHGYEHKNSYFDLNAPATPNDTFSFRSSPSERYPNPISNGSAVDGRRRQSSWGSNHSGHSPPLLTRSESLDTANQHFPLNDIDYESSPAAVAQELSNLQAIRRMSMNVDAADPDLPSFGPSFSVPPAAPSHTVDEDDAARMFWVPARLHPELAPKEFKTFVEDRVERIRRRSGDSDSSVDTLQRTGSQDSLGRRKSMLSKTIDDAIGYKDGADLLERKRSQSSSTALDGEHTLEELSSIVENPAEVVRKMSMESSRASLEGRIDLSPEDDSPILPTAPGGQSLKRSTRTNYRRGSLRKGERVLGSRRIANRMQEGEPDQRNAVSSQTLPATSQAPEDIGNRLARVQTEPMQAPLSSDEPDNFSRPSRKTQTVGGIHASTSLEDVRQSDRLDDAYDTYDASRSTPNPRSFVSRISSNGRTTASVPAAASTSAIEPSPHHTPRLTVPEIVETPPPTQDRQEPEPRYSAPPQMPSYSQQHPERKSSHEYSRQSQSQAQSRSFEQRLPLRSSYSNNRRPNQTLDDMASNPSMMPGTNTRTDALSFIPTFTEEKKAEKKSKDRKDTGERKTSWGWLLGNQDSEDKKDKKDREKEEKDSSKKLKSKFNKSPTSEKSHDSTRLDVLQTVTDGSRGRESLVLDRESLRLDDERKKDASSRKSTDGPTKKDSAGGIFSSLFGGSRKKNTERDSTSKKSDVSRRLSPEPPPQVLRADIDYNWTRFSILEERAIYRMAHLKLANPRRALYSQVLLSNFMYSYLAKVQQMHPQIQIPAFAQKQQEQKSNGASGGEGQDSSGQGQGQNEELAAWQQYQEQYDRNPSNSATLDSNSSSSGFDSGSSNTNFMEDYDPSHEESEELRSRSPDHSHQQDHYHQNYAYQQQPYTNSDKLGAHSYEQYSEHQDQQWDNKDLYTEQGLFDDARPPEEGEDLW